MKFNITGLPWAKPATAVTVQGEKRVTNPPGGLLPGKITSGEATPVYCDMSVSLAGAKRFTPVKDAEGNIVDYKDVTIRGYLSTFRNQDRDGDYVAPGAFQDGIAEFMKNPVLLVDHENRVDCIAGRFTKLAEDTKGLYFEARLTNSPAPWAADIRHKVANDELNTCSMGGFFTYDRSEGKSVIKEVALYEGSLTPIPANPEAVFSTRSLDPNNAKDAKMIKKANAILPLLGKDRGAKMMDKPRQPYVRSADEMSTGDPLDNAWSVHRFGGYANDLQEWAVSRGGSPDDMSQAKAAHVMAAEQCGNMAKALDAAGHSLSAFRMKRQQRYHQNEAEHIDTTPDGAEPTVDGAKQTEKASA